MVVGRRAVREVLWLKLMAIQWGNGKFDGNTNTTLLKAQWLLKSPDCINETFVEPCESSKTAKGRRTRKELAVLKVKEDIGVDAKTL